MDGPDIDDVNDFLSHHGIKGQKWGVRRNPRTGVRPIAQTLNDSRFGRRAQKNVDTHDRRVAARAAKKNKPVHEDAAAANAAKTKAKGGKDALSNKELQALVTRMNLEKQLKALTPPSKTKAITKGSTKFVADVLVGVGKQQVTRLANDVVTQQLNAALGKKK